MTGGAGSLPTAEFGFPGPLRDALVAAILRGEKTATSSLHAEYVAEGTPLPAVGDRSDLVDSDEHSVAVLEVTAVDVVPLASVPLRHALDEGEGFESVAAWRSAHESFWREPGFVAELPDLCLDDDTEVVLERFCVLHTG